MSTSGCKITHDNSAAIMKAIALLGKKDVLVGIPEEKSSRPSEPINNAELGYLMETGSPADNIPARPFLEPGVRGALGLIGKQLFTGAKSVASGDAAGADRALEAAGTLGRNAVVRYINDSDNFVPNAPSTIAAKGSDKPLIDKRELVKAVSYVVRD